ncbi:hypothetical protein GCM10007304_10530 [Rhodococcoides trifolii]|uniref:DUF3558 domain-containing protein n=1 Tax=Rhodococcoides trifolii TaxID=908250 RepID=A0A917FSJ2_9NOCA|nr:hypothetical protein GCM10007304_10530 [Rhodococcus trifolii]
MGKSVRVMAACAAVVVAAGCGSDAVAGSPTAAPLGDAQFDPCSIPDEAIAAAGADPGTEQPDIFGVDLSEWNVCKWDSNSWYYLGVLSTTYSFDQVRDNPQSRAFQEVVVGTRDAVSYLDVNDPDLSDCDVAFSSSRGVLIVRVTTKVNEVSASPPCDVATRAANALDSYLPR